MNSNLFSVLIANYNNGNYITETIKSIQKQTYENIEIIIVDDASTDNSIDIINRLKLEEPRIKLYKNEFNKGCGYTKNRCVLHSTGDICGFVDPEDTLSVDAIETVVKEHNNNLNASLVFSNYYHCDENLKIISLKKPGIDEGIVKFSQLYDRKINHFTTFKKNLYLQTDSINSNLKRAIDQDLYIKLEEVGDVIYINKNLYYYRYHQNGISAFNNNYKALYWYFLVKKETCIRRKINQEEFFANEYEKLVNNYKDTKEYKLGNFILTPIKSLRRFLFKLKKNV